MIEVELDGQIIEFPDGMSVEDIQAAVASMQAQPRESQDVDIEAAAAEAAAISPVREAAAETGEYLLETAKNIPASVGRQFQNLYRAGMNMPAVLEGISDLAVGGIEKSVRTASGSEAPLTEQEQMLESVIEDFGNRYGGREEFLQTLQQDPAGVALDASAVSSVFPKAARVNPVLATVEGTSRQLGNALKYSARRILEPVLKPKGTVPQRRRVLETALESGVRPTRPGLEKLQRLIDPLNARINQKLSEATKAGKTIKADDLLKVFDDLRTEYGPPKMEAVVDLKNINKMEETFRKSLGGIKELTPEQVQKIKTDLYGKVRYDTNLKRKEALKSNVRKQTAKRAKEEIADLVPEVGVANERLSRLLELQKVVDPRQRSISQTQLINPWREGATAATGAAIGTFINPILGGAAALGIEALSNPRLAPYTAAGLYRAGQGASAVGRAAGSELAQRVLPPAQWMIEQSLLAEALRKEREEQ